MNPKDFASALAILAKAQHKLLAEFERSLNILINAERAIRAQWLDRQQAIDTWRSSLIAPTPAKTTAKVRRSIARERKAQLIHINDFKREVEQLKRTGKSAREE